MTTRIRVPLCAAAFAVLCGATAAVASAAAPTTLYVSPTGDDANAGNSPAAPVRTLQRARDLVRTRNTAMTDDIVVSLAGGTYQLAETLTLDARDSGTGGHNVVWAAAPGARPVISGGRQLTGWSLSNPARNVWSAPAPAGLKTRQLFVDGRRAQRASGPAPVTLTKATRGYTTSAPTMDNWRNPAGIEFVYQAGLGGWTEPRCPVAAISPTAVTMAQPCWDNTDHRPPRISNQAWNLVGRPALHVLPTSVENAFELLDQPGEWYLDPAQNRVHYIPRPGEDLTRAKVIVPVLERVLDARGTATAPIHNVVFNGVQFSYGTWLRPSTTEGFSEIQATYTYTGTSAALTQGLCTNVPGGTCPYGAWSKALGNVTFVYAQNIQLVGTGFAHLGGAGLILGKGTKNSTVSGSVFTDVSANAIMVGDVHNPDAPSADRVSGNRIVDNYLHHTSVEYHSGVAIFAGYTERTTITHNQISQVPYTGISIGWGGWLDKIQQATLPNYSNRNAITNNLIFDHMLVLNDGGGVYVNGITGPALATGLRIAGNVIHDENGQSNSKGVYTDNGATNVTITGNGLYNNPIDWTRNHHNWGPGGTELDPLLIDGNFWMKEPPEKTGGGVTITNNTVITSPSQIPRGITDNAGLEPAFRNLLTWQPAA